MSQRRLQLAVGLVLFALAVIVSPASAVKPECKAINQSRDVSYSSSAYADPLGTGIAEAEPGDTIKVIGTCRGDHFYVDKDLTLTGRKSDQHDDAIVGGSVAPLLYVGDGFHATISNLHIVGGKYYGIGIFRGGLTVEDSWVSGVTDGPGIQSQYEATVVIDNSTVSGNGGGGITNVIGAMTVSGSTVTSNTANGDGGGIYNHGGDLTLTDSVVSGNTGSMGGGISSQRGGTVTLTRTAVSGNTGSVGGGIYNESALTIDDSTVSDNVANHWGGGILAFGPMAIHNSIIERNTAPGGGGIQNWGVATLDHTTVRSNVGGAGGGIQNQKGSIALTSSLVSGNSAALGGGIFTNGWLTLTDSTVTANFATEAGGGIYSVPGFPPPVLNGTNYVCGNTPDDWPGCSP